MAAMKTIKIQLLPNNKQQTKLFEYSGAARFAYNWALSKEMESLRNGKGFIPDGVLRKELTQLKQTEEYKWLNNIDVDVTKQAIKDLCNAFKRYFKLKKQKGYRPYRYFKLKKQKGYRPYSKKFLAHMKCIGKEPAVYQMNGHPKFKSKRNVDDYGFYQDVYKISFTENSVHLVLVSGRGKATSKRSKNFCNVKLAERNRVPVNAKYLNPRVTYDGLHWWISVTVETEVDIENQNNFNKGIGIDLGVKDLAICSDGFTYKNINKTRTVRLLEKRKRRLQRSISRKYLNNKKGESYCKTSNIIKSEKELLRIEQRLANIRQNHIHQTTSEIIKRKPSFICIEDLNVSGMMKNRHLSKAIQNQKFYMFGQVITYKSQWNAIKLVVADRFYPSSKKCSCCGNIKRFLKLSDRTYECKECGFVIDRDVNASFNLETYGKHCVAFC